MQGIKFWGWELVVIFYFDNKSILRFSPFFPTFHTFQGRSFSTGFCGIRHTGSIFPQLGEIRLLFEAQKRFIIEEIDMSLLFENL